MKRLIEDEAWTQVTLVPKCLDDAKRAAVGQETGVPSLQESNMRKLVTAMALLALAGCSTHTGQTGQMIADSAKGGDVLGAGS